MATVPESQTKNQATPPNLSGLTWFIALPIRFYRVGISPMIPNRCRHLPSCSEYALEALEKHGPIQGTWLTIKRIGRCHPWGTHGYDPVPDKHLSKKS